MGHSLTTFLNNKKQQSSLSKLSIDMPFAAAISSASKNARRSKGGHGVSEEETTPLNPNRNDYEDIENPFKMPGEVSKFDKECVQECLTKTIFVVMLVIIVMLFFMLFWLIWAILQCSAVDRGGAVSARAPLEFCHPSRNIRS